VVKIFRNALHRSEVYLIGVDIRSLGGIPRHKKKKKKKKLKIKKKKINIYIYIYIEN